MNEVKIHLDHRGDSTSFTIWDGKQQQKIPNFYGENDWTITYRDSLQCNIRHFKTRNTAIHDYRIKISKKSDQYYCAFRVKGSNELEIEQKLHPVSKT